MIKDAAEREKLRKELAELKADKTVTGKKVYAGAIAKHADLHGQQMPFERPVTDIPTEKSILDLLHALDLNLPKVDMKYTILDPVILDADMRLQIGDFLSEVGCSLDVQEKEKRDPNRKWFHGSVWHYDFVCGANKKSYGLHVNIFQLCLIVYGVKTTAPPSVSPSPASPPPSSGAKRKEAPTGAPHRAPTCRAPTRRAPTRIAACSPSSPLGLATLPCACVLQRSSTIGRTTTRTTTRAKTRRARPTSRPTRS